MLGCDAVDGSCAKVIPPSSLMALSPSVPSLPVPERMMPIAFSAAKAASEREESVDGVPHPARLRLRREEQLVAAERDLAGGRRHVERAGLHVHAVLDRDDPELARPRQDLRQ